MSWILYEYKNCDSCRKARKWLEARGVEVERRPIRETPPSADELRRMLGHLDNELRRLFNTSAANGNLIKRPFLLGPESGTVGFKEDVWIPLFDQ